MTPPELRHHDGMTLQDNPTTAYAAPKWAQSMRRFTDFLTADFGGGLGRGSSPRSSTSRRPGPSRSSACSCGSTPAAAWRPRRAPRPGSTWRCTARTASSGSSRTWRSPTQLAEADHHPRRRSTPSSACSASYWLFGWLLISGHVATDYPLPDNAWFALCITLAMLGSRDHDRRRRAEVLHAARPAWPHHRRDAQVTSAIPTTPAR